MMHGLLLCLIALSSAQEDAGSSTRQPQAIDTTDSLSDEEASPAVSEEARRRRLAQATTALHDQDHHTALALLTHHLAQQPTDPVAMVLMAWALNDDDEPERALTWLAEAQARGMRGAVWRREHAIALLQLGEPHRALEELSASRKSDGRALYARAQAHIIIEQRGFALADLSAATADPRIAERARNELTRLRTAPEVLPRDMDLTLQVGLGFEQNPGLGPDFTALAGPDGYAHLGAAFAYRFVDDATAEVAFIAGGDVRPYFVNTALTPLGVYAGADLTLTPSRAHQWSLRPIARLQVYDQRPLFADVILPLRYTVEHEGRTDMIDVGLRGMVHVYDPNQVLPEEVLSGGYLTGGYTARLPAGPLAVNLGARLDVALTRGVSRQHFRPTAVVGLQASPRPSLLLELLWETSGQLHLAVDARDPFGRHRLEWANEVRAAATWEVLRGQYLTGGYALAQRLSNIDALYTYARHTLDISWRVEM